MQALSAQTRLIDALSDDETTFDRLVAAYPVYRRFAGVLMRDDTATRLSLADIAHMGAIPPAEALSAACGRSGSVDLPGRHRAEPLVEGRPAWAEAGGDAASCFDARPLLQAGHEPLPDLLDFIEAAPVGAVLVIDATFHPQPLRRLLAGRGYDSAAEQLAPDHWRVYFRHQEGGC